MKNRLAVVGLALVAVLAMSAITANSAFAGQAPRWKVAGAFLGNGTTETYTEHTETVWFLRIPGLILNLTWETTHLHILIVGSGSESPGTVKEGTFTFKNAMVEGAEAVCTVNGTGTVTSNKLKGTLVWLEKTGGQAGLKLSPESGTELFTLTITGAECAVAGTYPVTNEVIAKLSPKETNVTEGEVILPATPKAECKAANAILKWWDNSTTRVEKSITQLAAKASPATICGTGKGFLMGKAKTYGVFPG